MQELFVAASVLYIKFAESEPRLTRLTTVNQYLHSGAIKFSSKRVAPSLTFPTRERWPINYRSAAVLPN